MHTFVVGFLVVVDELLTQIGQFEYLIGSSSEMAEPRQVFEQPRRMIHEESPTPVLTHALEHGRDELQFRILEIETEESQRSDWHFDILKRI